MTARRTSRGRSSGRSSRRRGYWDGNQWPSTAIPTGGTVIELVNTTAQEFMPATMVRIRGHICLAHTGSAAESAVVEVFQKIMYVEVNDAQAMTGDHMGIDTHEEDIAQRQLWTHATLMSTDNAVSGTESGGPTLQIEVDVKVKIKMEPHGKKLLVLLQDSTATNHVNSVGYLRCYLQHG